MLEGYNKIFWGIFITTFNIKFGPIKILPAFVGLLVVSNGLNKLYEESKLELFHKTQNIGLLTASMSFIGGVADYFSNGPISYSLSTSIWMVVYNVVELILFFKTLESSIEYLDSNNYPDLANEYLEKQRTYTIFSVINISLLGFTLLYNIKILMFFVPFIGVILRIYMMVLINRLKKLFMEVESSD